MTESNSGLASKFQRINGRLHSIHHVRDDSGAIVQTTAHPLKVELHTEDMLQLMAGACVMGLPVALTEDVWNLGTSLPLERTLWVLAISFLTLTGFIWSLFYSDSGNQFNGHFMLRCVVAYAITFLVCFLLLFLFDKAPPDDPQVALTRTIIVTFPASFAATAVDFMK